MVPVVLQADLDRTLGEAAAVGGDPHHHGAVAFPCHAGERQGKRSNRIAGLEITNSGEHARPQLVTRVLDFRAHQHAARARIDRETDRRDAAVKRVVPIG